MNYRIDKDHIYMTLDKGDLINKTIEMYAEDHDIGCAWIQGIGALENPDIGYYSLETKSYQHKIFAGDYELTSLIGNIAIKEEITVESIPGASASLAALISSGLPTDRFIFEGFLPPKKGRKARISRVKDEQATLIFYESPKRLQRTLKDLLDELGDRPAVVSRELTKLHEEIKRGTLSELLSYFKTRTLRGECVILIGKNDQNVYF